MKPTDCEAEDQETVCRTIYESECWTKQHETKVTDDVLDQAARDKGYRRRAGV